MSASGQNMNCEKYKEAIAADPSTSQEDVAAHVATCPSCASYLSAMQALDARIANALEVNVPDLKVPELPPIEDDNVVNLPFERKGKLRTPTWIGIAASFALAAIIGVQIIGKDPSADLALANEILAHLDHEPNALKVTNVAVAEEQLSRVVNQSVGTMDRDVGLITYAQSCVINGRTIPHLVIQGEKGPITLLLMPEEMIDGAVSLDGDSVNGVILPVGSGSIAIIGERDERLGEIEQRVVDSVEWSI